MRRLDEPAAQHAEGRVHNSSAPRTRASERPHTKTDAVLHAPDGDRYAVSGRWAAECLLVPAPFGGAVEHDQMTRLRPAPQRVLPLDPPAAIDDPLAGAPAAATADPPHGSARNAAPSARNALGRTPGMPRSARPRSALRAPPRTTPSVAAARPAPRSAGTAARPRRRWGWRCAACRPTLAPPVPDRTRRRRPRTTTPARRL